MPMTPEAKSALSRAIRGLRERLLDDLHASTEATYRLSLSAQGAGLNEATRVRRARLEAWLDEQVRGERERGDGSGRDRAAFLRELEQRAAYTLLNRLVLLRLMEGMGLRAERVLTGGWNSPGYQAFREIAPALVRDDPSEGYAYLLQLIFEDLALELPGLYGSGGVAELIPVGAATLRQAVEVLDAPALASCWDDDMTLGWVYQYWNDPEREALDAKLHAGGKLERHEIAAKTQMFTERYMVDWQLQNSLGPMWLAICRKHGWTADCERPFPGESDAEPDAESETEHEVESEAGSERAPDPDGRPRLTGLLRVLEERRADWRAKREAGEVSLTALMPLHSDAERCWAYYVPQPIPADAIDKAPNSVRDIRLLDPALGSGHFLVVAFELLFALYLEEARHRNEPDDPRWSVRAIVERILGDNLHGIDLDPRAVQIAAAALWLKARRICPQARPARLNLVASNLRLASLPDDDPALLELRREVERETGIPAALTDTLIQALSGADHLGSLLQIDHAVDEAIAQHEAELGRQPPAQFQLFPVEEAAAPDRAEATAVGGDKARPAQRLDQQAAQAVTPISRDQARADILERLESFLARHSGGNDLGLRLHGEQLAAGVRFLRMIKPGRYDLVIGNPPYQGTAKLADAGYIKRHYPLGKADLYAAFLLRGLQLVREGGTSALLTMRNWMFIKQYAELRAWLLERYDLRALGDFAVGAFDEVANDLLAVVVSVFRKAPPASEQSVGFQPTPLDDRSYDRGRTQRKRAATLIQRRRVLFSEKRLRLIPDRPVIYWWGEEELAKYASAPLVEHSSPARFGLTTGDNDRYCRFVWEVQAVNVHSCAGDYPWVHLVHGAKGLRWFDECSSVIEWSKNGIGVKIASEYQYGTVSKEIRNEADYFRRGVAFSAIGNTFAVRAHRFPSVFSNAGLSFFPGDIAVSLTALSSSIAQRIVSDLSPGMRFDVGDVNRIPLFQIDGADEIIQMVGSAFSEHESHREPSVEYKHPGPSPWLHAQAWAQSAVDRPEGAPLPPYEPEYDPEPPTDHLSFALGVALGRFGGGDGRGGWGILDPSNTDAGADLGHALPAGILFLDGTLEAGDHRDGLGRPAASVLHQSWAEQGARIDAKSNLRTWLRLKFFRDVHKAMYENRPIHWPLSSAKRIFVAWINIHRWDARTLRLLLADHLSPAAQRLDGELSDLRAARDDADRRAAEAAERRYASVLRWRDELADFIAKVEQCAERGAPPTDPQCPARACDAAYAPDLDDGVMINSAALWPLLEPQWKDPKKWWKELASATGKKDYDWSHLAMRHWPERVDAKCRQDPSLGVAHGCFWAYHPARAWSWELRLQDEIGPDFRIEEAPYRGDGGDVAHRSVYLQVHWKDALAAVAKEALRRRRKQKQPQIELRLLETGLWSRHPCACWQLELDLIAKQKADFHLRAPDEPASRAALERQYPSLVDERETLLRQFASIDDLLSAGNLETGG
ncbi:BREX-6 system adenine-specific DNA-methyltransferase PglX [Lamprobacter modestohalophilus]|uniref:BREX-6 system adenine-specific DNA-methyltransferase PglX n=1 Tax=Lamprobacter modestohalophilus TaxID=1064514 RepID=UPI002ADEDDF1|nr:BREX-6 system adenine-specific DNA-methyltransferase PglX [Lamprobacter modestohalophilus]MEA1048439.1 BREX-6 system adenine-specific DNA-methyltransferase PglX [Lamprobacter modestohalophilus]